MVNSGDEPHSKKPDAYMHPVIQMSGGFIVVGVNFRNC